MKIATFNCNSIRIRIPVILDWLAVNNPDVLCLQETKVQDQDFPTEPFIQKGYHSVFKGEKKYNGVAVISKVPPDDISFGFDGAARDESRLIKVRIGNSSIVNTYIPQGFERDSDKFQYKLDWFKRLLKYFRKHFKPDDPVIWLGDFNVAHKDIDVYDPVSLAGHVCFCPEVSESLAHIIQWGFVDLFRMHCDSGGCYTFWDYRVPNGLKRNIGWRLDYIMATRPLAEKCTGCYIDKEPRNAEKPSDHTFLVAEFNLGGGDYR